MRARPGRGLVIACDEPWAEGVGRVLEKVLELDPGYCPAVDHLLVLETRWGTPEDGLEDPGGIWRGFLEGSELFSLPRLAPGLRDRSLLLISGLYDGET